MVMSPNGFWHLSLPHSLFLGGVHNVQTLPASLREKGSFVGCIQKLEINERPVSIIAEALGGSNVDNCPHACVAKPCGLLAKCIPNLESYECECNPQNIQCNKAEEVSEEQLNEEISLARSAETTTTDIDTDQTTVIDLSEYYSEHEDINDKDDDYYYDDNSREITTENEIISSSNPEMSQSTSTVSPTRKAILLPTVTSSKETNAAKTKDPYQLLIDDFESHYLLKGRYLTADHANIGHSQQRPWSNKKTKAFTKKQDPDSKKKFIFGSPVATKSNEDYQLSYVSTRKFNSEHDKLMEPNENGKVEFVSSEDSVADQYLPEEMNRIMKDADYTYQKPPARLHIQPHRGACFNGVESYFHYSDAETMRCVISYQIDLNLRFKTHTRDGVILWSGRQSAREDDDFLSLGIENG